MACADLELVNRLRLDPDVRFVVIVLQVPARRATLRDKPERGVATRTRQARYQCRQGDQVSQRREDRIFARDLSATSDFARSGRAADAGADWKRRCEPRSVVSIANNFFS